MQNGTIFEKSQNIFLKEVGSWRICLMTRFWIPRVASPDGTMGQAQGRKKRWNRRLRKNVWPSWKMSWSRTSIPSIMMPNWKPRKKKPPRSAKSD